MMCNCKQLCRGLSEASCSVLEEHWQALAQADAETPKDAAAQPQEAPAARRPVLNRIPAAEAGPETVADTGHSDLAIEKFADPISRSGIRFFQLSEASPLHSAHTCGARWRKSAERMGAVIRHE